MNRKELIKTLMNVAENYKNGYLLRTGALTDIGVLVDEYTDTVVKNCPIPNVSTRTFRFSGIKDGEKFVKEIQSHDRESAIADFELTYPDLTWRFSTDIT